MGMHYFLQPIDRPGTYERILFVDSLAFNTIRPEFNETNRHLTQIFVPTPICQGITNFPKDRQQQVRHIQDSHYQHWRSSRLRPLPTALLPIHKWLDI